MQKQLTEQPAETCKPKSRSIKNCTIITILYAFIAVASFVVIPYLVDIYRNSGGDLPAQTTALISYYPYLWVLPLLTFLYCADKKRNGQRQVYQKYSKWIELVCYLFAFLLIPILSLILYLPFFSMCAKI
jgi:type II secretory pathway component PulF